MSCSSKRIIPKFEVHEFENLQSNSSSIVAFAGKWRNLQSSFTCVHNSLVGRRVREVDSEERENGVVARAGENVMAEIDLSERIVKFGEELEEFERRRKVSVISEGSEELEGRGKRFSEELMSKKINEGLLEYEEGRMLDHRRDGDCCRGVLEMKEKEFRERCEGLVVKEKELEELKRVLEAREKKIEERCARVEAREKGVCERSKELVVKEKELNEVSNGLGLKEENVNASLRGLELKKRDNGERGEVLKLKEGKVKEVCRGVELNVKRMDDHVKEMEIEGRQKKRRLIRGLSGKQTNDGKEKEMSEVCKAQGLEEKGRGKDCIDGHKGLNPPKEKQINLSCGKKGLVEKKQFDSMERRGIGKKQTNDRGDQLKPKDKKMSDEALELKMEHGNECVSKTGLIEKPMRDGFVKMKIKEINECMSKSTTESKQKQKGSEVLGVKMKQIGKQKKQSPLVKAFGGKPMSRVWKRAVSEEKEVAESCQMIDQKENKPNKVCEAQVFEEKQRGGNCIKDRRDSTGVKENVIIAPSNDSKLETKPNVHVKVLGLDEKQISFEHDTLGFKLKQVNQFASHMESKEKEVRDEAIKMRESNGCLSQLEPMEEKLSSEALEFKQEQTVDHNMEQNCEVKKEFIDTQSSELGCKEEQLKHCDKNLVVGNNNSSEKVVELNVNQMDDNSQVEDGQIVDNCCTEVELNGKEKNDSCDVEGSMQKPLSKCETNLVVENVGNESGALTAIKFEATDGKTLLAFLNARVDNHGSLSEEINSILKVSENPAKLVLDAIGVFYPHNLSKVDAAYEPSLKRNNCLLLLEQLMVLKPVINKTLRIEATKVALEWRPKMRAEGESEVLVLGYLLLVAAYNLTSLFIWDHLSRLCELVDHHRLTPQIRQTLCLAKRDKVSRRSTEVSHCIEDYSSSVEVCSDIHSLCRNMDAHGVVSYLIQHVMDHGVLHDQVLNALRYASDPARLVLDISQSFHGTDSDEMYNDAKEVSCIFLLGLLMKLSPPITPDVKLEARDFAAFWRARLHGEWDRLNANNYCSDMLGFLQFVAAYKLVMHYRKNNLFRLFKASSAMEGYPPEQIADLCSALGLQDKIPDLIRSLIEEQKQPVAVKYICMFAYESEFPPVPLLEAYLENMREKAEKIRKGTTQEKINAAKMEMACLHDVVECITICKLQSKLPPDSLIARINQLEKEMAKMMNSSRSAKKRCESASKSPVPVKQRLKRPRSRLAPNQQVRLHPFGHPPQIMPHAYPFPVRMYPPGTPVPMLPWPPRIL